jgi:plasmid stabilization system protein ParE
MPVEWRPEARAELWQILNYIGDRNVAAAIDLSQAIEATTSALPEHPISIDLAECLVPVKLLCTPTTWWFIN